MWRWEYACQRPPPTISTDQSRSTATANSVHYHSPSTWLFPLRTGTSTQHVFFKIYLISFVSTLVWHFSTLIRPWKPSEIFCLHIFYPFLLTFALEIYFLGRAHCLKPFPIILYHSRSLVWIFLVRRNFSVALFSLKSHFNFFLGFLSRKFVYKGSVFCRLQQAKYTRRFSLVFRLFSRRKSPAWLLTLLKLSFLLLAFSWLCYSFPCSETSRTSSKSLSGSTVSVAKPYDCRRRRARIISV